MYVVDGINNDNLGGKPNSNPAIIEPWLVLAKTAKAGGNNKEAIRYYNNILEIDITNEEAWHGKAQCVYLSSTPYSLKLNESILCFENAVKNANNKATVKKTVALELYNIVNTLHTDIIKDFLNKPRGKRYTIEKCRNIFCSCLNALMLAAEYDNQKEFIELAFKIINNPFMNSIEVFEKKNTSEKYFKNKMKELNPNWSSKVFENVTAAIPQVAVAKENVGEQMNKTSEELQKVGYQSKKIILVLYKIGKVILFSFSTWISVYLIAYVVLSQLYSGEAFKLKIGVLGIIMLLPAFIYIIVQGFKIIKSLF